ncbi:hypothetical protein DPMN_060715 [Dreissena polymorpha]|uniref:Uncharacterized protein n=1 Tax=Dreissena polymorpha TaxID=45954 RepID=A0A9D4HHS4_DREPO|nr:hypothetical protein DPMN_060715 [Dreissena polymorpha]
MICTTKSSSSSGAVSPLTFNPSSAVSCWLAKVTLPEWSTMSLFLSPVTSQDTTV